MRGIATFFIAIVAAALAGAAGAAAQTIEGLKGPAAAAIRVWKIILLICYFYA